MVQLNCDKFLFFCPSLDMVRGSKRIIYYVDKVS